MVENELIIMAGFLTTGLLAYVIIPGLLDVEGRRPETREDRSLRRMWDRVLDHMEAGTGDQKK